jgi:FlaA1/EpsC-like NDP-sugar epimerase
VTSSLEKLNWRSFLARPRLPSPPPEVLDALYQEPLLITGAGGSIGSALALRLATLSPSMLLLLESSEHGLYNLREAWEASNAACPMAPILGNVLDRSLLEEVFTAHAPRIVFHAAAFKHVPMMEEHPLEAIANNILGTETLVSVAGSHGAHVVLISTDKAVEPASVMGATKRVAEQIVLTAGGTVLRLGNVLASHGSVAGVFARQIAQGAPVTVTDPAARRYFLTMDEAVNLLLFAAARPVPAALLAPALTASHSIAELATFIAHELAPESQLSIDVIGLRPGDKQVERLWPEGEITRPVSQGEMVSIQTPLIAELDLLRGLDSLHAALEHRDLARALGHLRDLVPDYRPSQAVQTLSRQFGPRVCT